MWTLNKIEIGIIGCFLGLGIGYVVFSSPDIPIPEQENWKIRALKAGDENFLLKQMLEGYRINSHYIVELTAYTARKEETNNDPGNTAIMEKPISGWTIAVSQDLKHLLGKRVYIRGFGVRRVNDLMNSRYTKRVDILVSSVSEARKIGLRKNIKLVILEPELLFKENVIGELG